MNLRYLLPRMIRHFMSETWVRYILRRSWIIRPGIETTAPVQAAQRYLDAFEKEGTSIINKRVMVFGYGGHFALGAELLRLGASHIVLVDKFAPADDAYNRTLLSYYKQFLSLKGKHVIPKPEVMTIIEDDIRNVATNSTLSPVDIVVSNSVYEHLDDVAGITGALARVTHPDGIQLHFIDLRDHYFMYPFEMLCYSERIWFSWLNPSSHHNRYRLWDYEHAFKQSFAHVKTRVLKRDERSFQKVCPRILPQFKSGNLRDDSVTHIQVFLGGPFRK